MPTGGCTAGNCDTSIQNVNVTVNNAGKPVTISHEGAIVTQSLSTQGAWVTLGTADVTSPNVISRSIGFLLLQ